MEDQNPANFNNSNAIDRNSLQHQNLREVDGASQHKLQQMLHYNYQHQDTLRNYSHLSGQFPANNCFPPYLSQCTPPKTPFVAQYHPLPNAYKCYTPPNNSLMQIQMYKHVSGLNVLDRQQIMNLHNIGLDQFEIRKFMKLVHYGSCLNTLQLQQIMNLVNNCLNQYRILHFIHLVDRGLSLLQIQQTMNPVNSCRNQSHQSEYFEVLQKHKVMWITLLRTDTLSIIDQIRNEHLSCSDFAQGQIGNCGLISTLASLSQRPEFLTDIIPRIYHTILHFNMFYKGNLIEVEIDNALPFDCNYSLVYARSEGKDKLYLSSLFEKVFVKQACNYSYKQSEGTRPTFVFSTFSDCMVASRNWLKKDSKQNMMDYLAFELDNKSSVVVTVGPWLSDRPEKAGCVHSYAVRDYNIVENAVKLYNPHVSGIHSISDKKLLLIARKGEFWVTMDQFEGRDVQVDSLCSKKMYKSVFKSKPKVETFAYGENAFVAMYSYKLTIKEASIFMINLFSYSHTLSRVQLNVTTADGERRNVKLNFELPNILYAIPDPFLNKGEARYEYFQKFQLQPNSYVLNFQILSYKNCLEDEDIDLLMKIGSVSECKFEESNDQTVYRTFKPQDASTCYSKF